jgi:transcriptional regulator GlxA family with amidase domain
MAPTPAVGARIGVAARGSRFSVGVEGLIDAPTSKVVSAGAFFDRFTRTLGLPPMEYLLAWRMAVARDLLRRQDCGIAEVAERVGYGSANTFSTAFSRHVGQPPGRYARAS